MIERRVMKVARLAGLLAVVAVEACDGSKLVNDAEGAAQVALTSVPADVRCLQLVVEGSRTVTRLVDVTPGQPTAVTMKGLPIGAVTVSESAFALACNDVGTPTIAAWISDPVATTLVAGAIAKVTVVLHRNGQVVVTSTFDDDPDGAVPSSADAGPPADAGACVPFTLTTACSGRECGTVGNGCGGLYSCGACDNSDPCFPQHCGSSGLCVIGSTTCLAAGTQIALADGSSRPIEQIRIGDDVLAYDVVLGAMRPRPVLATFRHAADENYDGMVLVDGVLRATGNHPVYAGGRWIRADHLAVGDSLVRLSSAGAKLSVPVQKLELLGGSEETFNLEVDGDHNYFANGVLVHNKPLCF